MKHELYIAIMEHLKRLIRGTGFEGHVLCVGGCCRDELMGDEIKDIDLVVALPEGGIRFAEWLEAEGHTAGKVVSYPRYHTAMFRLKDFPDVEIETVQTRKEKYTERNSRNPETAFGTLEEDILRRDLTINSLCRNISTGELVVVTGKGLDDIRDHIIRTPVDPDITYDDDPLRILRTIRFASRYGWEVERRTWEGMVHNVSRLEIITRERVRDELEKMLASRYPVQAMEMLRRSGAMHYVIPELEDLYDLTQNKYHSGTAWEHTMQVLDVLAGNSDKPVLRMAALLHDIGKASTRSCTEDGKIHFIGHEKAGADMVESILADLRCCSAFIQEVRFLVLHHMDTKRWGVACELMKDKHLRRFQYQCGTEERFMDLMTLINADNMAHSPEHCMPEHVPHILKRTEEMKAEGTAMFGYRLPLTGTDVMRIKGLKPGPAVNDCLEYLLKIALVDPSMDAETMAKHLKGYRIPPGLFS